MPKHGGGNPNDKPNNFNLAVKKLMHYLNKYKFRIIFALIFSAFSSVLAIISPKRLEKLINIIIAGIITGIDIDKFETAESLLAEIRNQKIELDAENIESLGRGNLIDQLYKKVSRPSIIEPTFLIKHPIDLSPLARSNDENPNLTDRFQLIVNGQEIINGYSELVDAREQERRLIKQSELKAQGDEEAMSIDKEYIRAMEYGMPPISGWGLGVDRFLQFLTSSQNIRDVVLYPLMRPRDWANESDDEE